MKTTRSRFFYLPEARSYKLEAGFSVAEILVAAAIVGIGIAGILAAFVAYQQASGKAVPQTIATFLAEEGIEAVMVMRDADWSSTIGSYSVGLPYYLEWTGTWVATTTATTTDGMYYRTVTFADVYRDTSNDQIVATGGTVDPNSRLATSTVAWWNGNATSSVSVAAYVSNLFDY
jgi:Tfp pilus assembly protein PilV